MTQIYFERDAPSFRVSAQGHATGSVEVCAAVSGILYALAGYLKNAPEAEVMTFRLESGDVELDFTGAAGCAGAWEMALIGLKQIAQKYPEQVRVTP